MDSGSFIVTDLTLALLPLTFILPLRRSRQEKTLIAVLMSLGIFASIASIVKTVYLTIYTFRTPDVLYTFIDISLWAKMEEMLITIAASGPTLKGPVERIARRARGWISKDSSRPNATHGEKMMGKRRPHNNREHDGDIGFVSVRDEERALETSQKSDGEEQLKPRWWFLPNGFVHTELITTLDLNAEGTGRGNEQTRATTDLDTERSLGTDWSDIETSMASFASNSASRSWYGRSQDRIPHFSNG